jgi:hypothetical protein
MRRLGGTGGVLSGRERPLGGGGTTPRVCAAALPSNAEAVVAGARKRGTPTALVDRFKSGNNPSPFNLPLVGDDCRSTI